LSYRAPREVQVADGILAQTYALDEDAALSDSGKPTALPSSGEPDLVGVTLDGCPGVARAVFVGDAPGDVEAANRAGIGCTTLATGGFSSMVAESPAELRAETSG
jgi:phosphoglycolate phosphatase-like HAD superfamily hydrolase